jgi:hypothetical protein
VLGGQLIERCMIASLCSTDEVQWSLSCSLTVNKTLLHGEVFGRSVRTL